MKACSIISIEEILQLAGVAALTIPSDLLRDLSAAHQPEQKMAELSLFRDESRQVKAGEKAAPRASSADLQLQNFVDDEAKFRIAFARREDGKGYMKTIQVRENPIKALLPPWEREWQLWN